jgi:hypothetical protein
MKTSSSEKWNSIKTNTGYIWEGMKADSAEKWTALKQGITDIIESLSFWFSSDGMTKI